MPRKYRTQKEVEKFLIGEFLAHLGYRISTPRWIERPDALLTLSKNNKTKQVAIEHTEYFNDTRAGTHSPLTPYAAFWKLVQGSLIRRISHRKHLTGIHARVWMMNIIPELMYDKQLARKLAQELVAFTETLPNVIFHNRRFRNHDFSQFPTMSNLCKSILLTRWTEDVVHASSCAWTCNNISTGGIGLSLNYLKSAIRNKNKKAINYNWGKADEKWLLIAASGHILSNSAGSCTQSSIWSDTELRKLCNDSPFDHIVFWERPRCWYKWLKPNKSVVRYQIYR